jgi:putative hydrolase
VNDRPESIPPSDDDDEGSVPFEEVVKGLEGLGADVEREVGRSRPGAADSGDGRRGNGGDQDDPGRIPPGQDALAGLLGALGLDGLGGGAGAEGLAGLAANLGQQIPGFDPQMLMMMMGRIQSLINSGEGSVNWPMAREVARTVAAAEPDPSPTDGELSALQDAVRLAEHWLDAVTDLPAGTTGALAWSRAEWIENTLPVWKQLVEPVAERMTGAMAGLLPSEAGAMGGPLGGMIKQMGGSLFGHQVGTALAKLAGEVLVSSEIGLPLGPDGKAVLLPANVAAFGADLAVPAPDVRLYLALRESAYHRLFAHVPWLKGHVLGAVEAYARGISVDEDRIEQLMRSAQTPEGMADLQHVFEDGIVFTAPDSPGQRAALARLETILALTEGWVDAVVDAAAAPNLPSAAALRETMRRRRASGGPAEQTFAALVGLELRPRRLRDAARLWASLADARGTEGRDALWGHPDMLPTPQDLDDPDGFVHRDEFTMADFDFSDPAPEPTAPEQKGPDTQGSDTDSDTGESGPDDADGESDSKDE